VPVLTSSPARTMPGNTGPAELAPAQVGSLAEAFAAVPDPRSPRGRWHPLVAILLIAACAVTCDANGFTAIWQWADDAPPWVLARLRVRIDPLTGTYRPPSERTIRRTIARVDPQRVEQAAGAFIATRLAALGLGSDVPPIREREARRRSRAARSRPRVQPARCLAADGKVLRGARRPDGTRVTLLGTAEHTTGTVIAQREIDAKSNETPELRTQLAGMDLTGCLLTADAAQCCKATATAIVAAAGDYLLTLKANQVALLNTVTPLLSGTDEQWADRSHTSVDRGHGRTEQRTVRLTAATGIDFPTPCRCFAPCATPAASTASAPANRSSTASPASPPTGPNPPRPPSPSAATGASKTAPTTPVRDTTFDEDRCQVRTGNAPRNMATLRNLAIDTFRANGHANIAHARRHHAHSYHRILDFYGL
jgi:predicted transposase YbfD/YdcC